MPVLYTNNATSTLSAGISAVATSLAVAAGQGARFPAISGSDYFYATLVNSAGSIEIVKVTAVATDTFTVTRAQDGTTALAWNAGDRIEVRVTKAMLDDLKGERIAKSGDTFTGQVKIDNTGTNTSFFVNSGTSSGFITHLMANTSTFAGDNGATSGALFGNLSQPTISNSGAGGANGNVVYGASFIPQIASSGASALVGAYGVQAFAERSNAADVSTNASNALYAGFFTARHTTALGNSVSSGIVRAVTGSAIVQGGTVSEAHGVYSLGNVGSSAVANNTVSVTNYAQFYGGPVSVGSAANSYGTIANFYGLYLSAPTVAARGTITNRYGVYQADGTAANYFAGSMTLQAGTANGVAYLNASKVVTTGSALVFDGTNLGIGTSSPTTKLDVSSSGTTTLRVNRLGVADVYLTAGANSIYGLDTASTNLGFGVNNTLRMTLDSSGNLGLGVTPSAWQASWKVFQASRDAAFGGTDGGSVYGFMSVNTYADDSAAPSTATWRYKLTGSLASKYEQTSGEHRWFNAPSGTAGNAITFTQAMTLDASGNLLVGQTSSGTKNSNSFGLDVSGGGYLTISHINGSASGTRYEYYAYNGAEIGSVTQNGTTAVLFNTTSDRRLKDNIVPAPSASDVIDAIEIVSHDWKSAPDEHVTYGVIAQDLALVAPQAVLQGDDGDEIERTWGVDYSKLVPMLIKEIQSLRARVAALESA